jgi:glycosyltransferase involved in cell wall biosynthesis
VRVANELDEPAQSEWLSFVIPVREEGAYIGQTLEHLSEERAKNDLDFKVIVVDGGSTDDTVECSQAADLIIVDNAKAAESIGHARNIGAFATESELIFHTDADVLIPNLRFFLQRVAAAFEESTVVGVTVPVLPYPWDARPLDRVMHSLINFAVQRAIPFGAFLALGECQIVRRSAFVALGGYEGTIILGEDRDFLQRLARYGRVVYLKDIQVFHSARRYRKLGYRRVLFDYFREGVALATGRPSPFKEWTPVR